MARGKNRFFIFLFFACLALRGLRAQEAETPPLWRQALGGALIGCPVAQVESVVAVTDGGNLRSCSSAGNFLWDYFAGGRLTPHVSRSREGTSYICRTNGLLIAVNRSGRELWRVNLKTPLICPVIIGWDGRLFAFTDRKITCMTAAGFTLWSRTFEEKFSLAPLKDSSGGVIAAQENGEILRLDPFGSAVSFRAGNGPSSAPLSALCSLEIDGHGLSTLLFFENRSVELVHVFSGGRESLRGIPDLPSPPIAALGSGAPRSDGEHTAAVLLKDGRVAFLSIDKKKTLWIEASHINAGELQSPDDCRLLFDERGVYVLTKSGATGFASDGRRLWTTRLKGAAAIPSFGDDGILYSGGGDWILYAYRLEDRVRAKQRLLYGEAPEGNYGTGNPGPSSWADYHFRFDETEMGLRFAEIQHAIREGNIGASEKEYAAWLMETAESSLEKPPAFRQFEMSVRPPVHAQRRAEALALLSFIGSRETIPFLTGIFARDSDPSVKAAAARAIGTIGVDPEGVALRAFEAAVFPPLALEDEGALSALAAGVGALCRFSGPPLSDAGVRILTLLSGYDRFPLVRSQAQSELASLKRPPGLRVPNRQD